jgi:ketosteroid isomerase-like protein
MTWGNAVSQENVNVVKRFEQLMVPSLEETDPEASERRLAEVLAILDPDVVMYASPTIPHGGTYRGYDAFFKMGEQFRDMWDISDGVELRYIDGGGDLVITLAKWNGVSRLTGKTAPVDMVEVVTVRDGRIKELRAYYEDTLVLSEAADGAKGKYNPGIG